MKTILKVTIKNMFSKKFRSLMLLVSIVMSAALVYAVLILSKSTEEIFINNIRKEYGNTDIVITKDDYTFFDEELSFNESKYDYVLENINIYGYASLGEKVSVNVNALSLDDFESVYDIEYIGKQQTSFIGNNFLIGEENAKKYDLSIGDEVKFTIKGIEETFVLWGIVKEGNSYLDINLNSFDVLLDPSYIKDTFIIEQVNQVLIKTTESSNIDNIMEEISANYPLLKINNIYDEAGINELMKMISTPLTLMASTVILISAFIIYSTYKIITIERMPLMGTLRSIGATKKMTINTLLLESSIYGLVGGILGNLIGIGFTYLILQLFFGSQGINFDGINYIYVSYMILTTIMAIILSVISSIVPIVRVSNYSIKSIMFAEVRNEKELSIRKSIIGFGLILISYIIVKNISAEYGLLFAIIGTLISIIGGVLIIPMLVKILNIVVKVLLTPIFKNKVDISLKSINNDKTLMNNIVLLATGLGVIFMISNFSTSVSNAVTDAYKNGKSDLIVAGYDLDQKFIDSLNDIEMIENITTTKVITNIETDRNFSLMQIEGVDLEVFSEYGWNEFGDYLNEDLIDRFNNEKTIIITDFTSRKYDINIGDKINLNIKGKFVEYEVIETISSLLNNGNMNYININNFTEDTSIDTYQNLFIKVSGDIDQVKQEVKESYPYGILPIISLDEMQKVNEDQNNMIFVLLRSISILAMLIGSIGILNNFLVSFISRRKLIASLRSLGLSIKNTVKLFIVESFICGLIGSIIGLVYGVILFTFVGFIMEGLNITTELLSYNISDIIFVLISGIILSVVASIIPALNISRQNIVSQIKYE